MHSLAVVALKILHRLCSDNLDSQQTDSTNHTLRHRKEDANVTTVENFAETQGRSRMHPRWGVEVRSPKLSFPKGGEA